MNEVPGIEKVRLDKWLWAARFFKTRPLATQAIIGGKVQVNGLRIRPGKAVCIGDQVAIRRGRYSYVVIVRALASRRGPALRAALLYEETEESRQYRAQIADQQQEHRALRAQQRGRPTKRDRRTIVRFLRRRN